MEIITRQMETNQIGKRVINQFMVDEDYNIPDSKDDVQKVIMGEGIARITEMKPVENYLMVQGQIEFQILYHAEGFEPRFVGLEGKLPFEEMIYIEDGADKSFDVKCVRVDLNVSMVHSRKLRLKAMVEMQVESEYQSLEALPIDVECDYPVYKKQKEMELLKLQVSKKDTYRVKEEINLPGTKESIGVLLWADIANRKLDTKLVDGEVQLLGELLVFCFYESPDGKIDWVEQIVPYQGRVECYGVEEHMYHHVQGYLEEAHADVRADEDGEMRVIGIEGTLQLYIAVYEEEQMELLEDLYSLEKNCVLEKKDIAYEQLILQNHSKCKVMERLSIPELKQDVLQICHSNGAVQIDRMEQQEDGVRVEGALQVGFLYVKESDDMPFDTWQGMVPFSYLIECSEAGENMRYYISAMLEQLSITLQGGDEIEVKAVLAFHGFFERVGVMPMIQDVRVEEISMEEVEKRPSIVGYIVKPEDDLWALAKKYSTSVEAIMEVNELSGESIKPGERLLIFKENMSIL